MFYINNIIDVQYLNLLYVFLVYEAFLTLNFKKYYYYIN